MADYNQAAASYIRAPQQQVDVLLSSVGEYSSGTPTVQIEYAVRGNLEPGELDVWILDVNKTLSTGIYLGRIRGTAGVTFNTGTSNVTGASGSLNEVPPGKYRAAFTIPDTTAYNAIDNGDMYIRIRALDNNEYDFTGVELTATVA